MPSYYEALPFLSVCRYLPHTSAFCEAMSLLICAPALDTFVMCAVVFLESVLYQLRVILIKKKKYLLTSSSVTAAVNSDC